MALTTEDDWAEDDWAEDGSGTWICIAMSCDQFSLFQASQVM